MKRTVILLFYLFLCLFFVISSYAFDIAGEVRDKTSGKPLRGAHVIIEGTGTGTVTDQNGIFSFHGINPGNYKISASFLGYHVNKINVNLVSDISDFVLSLSHALISTDDVVITASRAVEGIAPASFSNMSGIQMRETYWAQDIPMLLESIPGVYSYSDAGNGIGYSNVKIRGFDQTRIAVTINNIPLNDPEDGQVYWVDMPDLAANLEDAQVQRGVGYSPYGTGGFGGTINLLTLSPQLAEPQLEATFGGGSFNTRKWGLAYNSGLINNTYGMYGRFSRIQTDGYRDRSGVELWSYFLTATRYWQRSKLTINVYGGPELTHAAWNASAESDINKNRKHNPYTYENTIDNFYQPHYELHHSYTLNPNIQIENSLFYIRGEGYYEQYKSGEDLEDFGYQEFYTPTDTITETDLVNQKWVKKNHVGWVPRLIWEQEKNTLQVGGDLQWYQGDHFGYVIWGDQLPPGAEPQHQYYAYNGQVSQAGLFVHDLYRLNDKTRLIGDLEFRHKTYSFKQTPMANFQNEELNAFNINYTFLNPKFGLSYDMTNELNLFGGVGLTHRAPYNDEYWDVWQGPDDLGKDPLFNTPDTIRSGGQVERIEWSGPIVEPEQLIDFELGTSFKADWYKFKLGAYWMEYKNAIIPYGGVNDGAPVKDNADRSVHRGLEFEAVVKPIRETKAWLNASISDDRLTEYLTYNQLYDDDWNPIGTETIDLSDNHIALFPSIMLHGGVSYYWMGFVPGINLRYVGKQYLDNTEDEDRTIDPFSLLGLSMSYKVPENIPLSGWEIKFRANNLLDEEYETAGWYDSWEGENFYFVGAERNYFVTLTARY
ncbi:MAG: TonB-dependent receptor [Candidatus Electryonea clarkiae]|nr:TonB-dependent receptor [Candidatus Electryonea clarkiae]MDP8287550.1 TonB-dependent receptor [Candidatus Electryonea clarkiae]